MNKTKKSHVMIQATIYDKKGKVLARGKNSYEKTHPIMMKYNASCPDRIYLHAEIAALVKVRSGIPYKIFIERYDKNGNPKLAAPCLICQAAIREAGIQRIEYTIG